MFSRDACLVIASRAVRTVGYGTTSVLLATLLLEDGRAPAQVAILIAVASAGSVQASLLLGRFADRWGRRRSLMISAGLMALAGLIFAGCESYPLLLVAAFIGTVSPSTNDNTPFSGVEQSILAQSTVDGQLTRVFSWYNMMALLGGAAGGLVAAGLRPIVGISVADLAFGLYAGLAVITLVLSALLSGACERPPRRPSPRPRPVSVTQRLSGQVRWLAGLFAIDAFAGGLAVQTMLAWWLHHRFGATPAQLGLLFFATNLLSALSLLAAPPLARRHGLLATMLIPHAASNVLLLGVAFVPSLRSAAILLIARHALSKIDVPARQAFVAAVVAPAQRTAAASLTSVARSVAVCASPMACSALLAGPLAAVGAPLVLAAVLSIGYDAAVWRTFRR